jgi:hypothetical protein
MSPGVAGCIPELKKDSEKIRHGIGVSAQIIALPETHIGAIKSFSRLMAQFGVPKVAPVLPGKL